MSLARASIFDPKVAVRCTNTLPMNSSTSRTQTTGTRGSIGPACKYLQQSATDLYFATFVVPKSHLPRSKVRTLLPNRRCMFCQRLLRIGDHPQYSFLLISACDNHEPGHDLETPHQTVVCEKGKMVGIIKILQRNGRQLAQAIGTKRHQSPTRVT